MRPLLVMLAALGMTAASSAQKKTGFLDRVYKNADGSESKYVLFIPEKYDAAKKYPAILFLHGAGETGSDGKKQVKVGLGPAVKKRQKDFPFIVIFPQASDRRTPVRRRWHADSPDGKRALAILKQTQKEYNIDSGRLYLTGLSMGGYGTWDMAAALPERWAAVAPVCGGGDPKAAPKFKGTPCWCFHGDRDRAVQVDKSREMIAALKKAGGEPRYTEYPGVGHNCWDRAYGTDGLYEWMLSFQRAQD